jgi:hypothetical protein
MESRLIVPLAGEIWQDIPWTHGVYQVSNKGRVRRAVGFNSHNYCAIAYVRKKRGYSFVRIAVDGRQRDFPIHRLVAEAFLGKCPKGLAVNHKDGVKINNTPENLEYVTNAENTKHAWQTGLMSQKLSYGCVYWYGKDKRWRGRIRKHGKEYFIGNFKRKLQALYRVQEALDQLQRD